MKRRTILEFKELVAIHPAVLRAKRGLISVMSLMSDRGGLRKKPVTPFLECFS